MPENEAERVEISDQSSNKRKEDANDSKIDNADDWISVSDSDDDYILLSDNDVPEEDIIDQNIQIIQSKYELLQKKLILFDLKIKRQKMEMLAEQK